MGKGKSDSMWTLLSSPFIKRFGPALGLRIDQYSAFNTMNRPTLEMSVPIQPRLMIHSKVLGAAFGPIHDNSHLIRPGQTLPRYRPPSPFVSTLSSLLISSRITDILVSSVDSPLAQVSSHTDSSYADSHCPQTFVRNFEKSTIPKSSLFRLRKPSLPLAGVHQSNLY